MIWLIIVIIAVVLDQFSKWIVVSNIEIGDKIPVINNFFYITHIKNKGAAWGIFQNGRYFFIILTLVVSIVITYFLFKEKNNMLRLSLSFILGGGIGNIIDRIFVGSVVDFIDVYLGSYDYPKFNIADCFVVVGTVLLAYYLIFVYKDPTTKKNTDSGRTNE